MNYTTIGRSFFGQAVLCSRYIVHDESKESIAFAKALKVSIKDHTLRVSI